MAPIFFPMLQRHQPTRLGSAGRAAPDQSAGVFAACKPELCMSADAALEESLDQAVFDLELDGSAP